MLHPDLELAREIIQYFYHVILGQHFDISKCSSMAKTLILDIKANLAQNQFELSEQGFLRTVAADLDSVVDTIGKNNKVFFSTDPLANPSDEIQDERPHLKTVMVTSFYTKLSYVAQSSLDCGLSSNRYVYNVLHSEFYRSAERPVVPVFQQFVSHSQIQHDDSLLLEKLIAKQPVAAENFADARFWGNVAKNLLDQQQKFVVTVPPEHLDAIQKSYWILCQSRNKIVDPFSVRLGVLGSVDPVHWSTPDYLLAFVRQESHHPLSRSVRDVVCRLLSNLLDARLHPDYRKLLPAHAAETYDRFLKNVCYVDRAVPKVRSKHVPPVLVDVFQRLLAYTKFDHLWQDDFSSSDNNNNNKEEDNFFRLYVLFSNLEKENLGLRRLIPAADRQQFVHGTRPTGWMKRTWTTERPDAL